MAAESSVADNVKTFPRVARSSSQHIRRPRCAFRSGESIFYPYLDEVIWIQARRNYSQVNVRGSSFTVREVLASIERRLAEHGFVRVQRSSIVNLEHIVEIRRERRGRYSVILSDGNSVEVPPPMKDRLEQLLSSD